MVDIARSPEVKRKKKVRRILYGAVALVAIVLITVGVSRLRPAAPGVDRATVWIDTVKRGPMIRQVRGSGILVPENIRWITATTSGRIERYVLVQQARSLAIALGVISALIMLIDFVEISRGVGSARRETADVIGVPFGRRDPPTHRT